MTTSPDGGHDDIDARFADIVARWDDPPADAGPSTTGRDPRAGTPDGIPGEAPDAGSRPEPELRRPAHGSGRAGLPADLDGSAEPDTRPEARHPGHPVPWREHVPPEDDEEEGFEPPPTSPLPPFLTDWSFYLALVGLVGGPLWLIYLAIFADTERHQMWMAGALTLAGFVTLVLRQPLERDEDDTDDGARV